MHYVLDTGFFRISRDYYHETFPSFWQALGRLILIQEVSSVSEVKKELENYGGEQDYLLNWIKTNKNIFTIPSKKEEENMRRIFSISNFTNLISKQTMLEGKPWSDPFVIAKAMAIKDGIVVTTEKFAKKDRTGKVQGSPKILDVCKYFDVDCISPQEFMKRQNWQF